MDIINDPNKLEPMLIEAVDKLKERESDLETRLLPYQVRDKVFAGTTEKNLVILDTDSAILYD